MVYSGCGGRLAKRRGTFNSPGYPSAYPRAVDCVWEIETEPGSRVELTILNFDIETGNQCVFDFLQVLVDSCSIFNRIR